jgi:CTP-dependent riboflavin kinase
MATVSKTTRETVEAVKKLTEKSNQAVNITKVAKALGIDRSAVSRRVVVAVADESLNNLEERDGSPQSCSEGKCNMIEACFNQLSTILKSAKKLKHSTNGLNGCSKENAILIPWPVSFTLVH